MGVLKIDTASLARRVEEAQLFTNHFGSFNKTDYEVLMFTVYLDSLDEYARDYDISLALGITESKVRSLRVKSQLLYPKPMNWVDELHKSLKNGYYDDATGLITVTIEDPSVQNLIKNKIEEGFGVVGQTLNKKQLVLPLESFLLLAAYSEDDEEKTIRNLNKIYQKHTKTKSTIEKKQFKERFMAGISDKANFLSALLTIYETGKPILQEIIKLIA